jgi:hypothetical protein
MMGPEYFRVGAWMGDGEVYCTGCVDRQCEQTFKGEGVVTFKAQGTACHEPVESAPWGFKPPALPLTYGLECSR